MPLRQDLCHRFSMLGIRQSQTHRLVDAIVKWHRNNGSEWTVARLKSFKTESLRILAGGSYEGSWVAKKNGIPRGPFGVLFRLLETNPDRALNALNSATLFISGQATKAQLDKFISSVGADPSYPALTNEWFKRSSSWYPAKPNLRNRPPMGPWKHVSEFHWSAQRRAPLTNGKSVSESAVDLWLVDNSYVLSGILYSHMPSFKEFKMTGILLPDRSLANPYRHVKPASTGGRIGFIQEPGFKLRAVANPYRVWQIALNPLKEACFKLLKMLPHDYTYDQLGGANVVKGWLGGKDMVYSVDLSDATNRAPYQEQREYLRICFADSELFRSQLDLLHLIVRSDWKLPNGNNIRWTKGQPLGLGPSFAMFALWHNGLCSNSGMDWGSYAILGDDICIKGESNYRKYMSQLENYDMPVSASKCLASRTTAEFAGKVIRPDRVITVGKWRQVSDRSFVDLARALGPQSLPWFRPRQRKVLGALAPIPEFFGGLGWNGKGLPFDVRIDMALRAGLLDVQEDLTNFTSPAAQWRNTLWNIASSGLGLEAGFDEVPNHLRELPTGSFLEDLNAQLDICEGVAPADFLTGVFTSGGTSDPRGVDLLTLLERRLFHSSSPDEDMALDGPDLPCDGRFEP